MPAPCGPAGTRRAAQEALCCGSCGAGWTLCDPVHEWRAWLSVLLVAALLVRPSDAFCPQECVCNTTTVSCENAGLEVVPYQLNPAAETIILRGNRISTLEYSLDFYLQLQSLDISLNRLTSLGNKRFDPLDQLVHLNVSGNNITAFGNEAFKGLRALRILDISNNSIRTLERHTFAEMHDLWELHLTANKLASLQEDVFHALVNLRVLKLGNNDLLSVPSEALVRLTSLRVLTLDNNLIAEVEDNAFPSMKDLVELTLDNNVLADIQTSAFEDLVSLERLDLHDNNISSVPTVQLSRLQRLTFLDLSGNEVSVVGPVAFHSLMELRVLKLNRLYRLTRVDARAFADNKRLESVWLERNLLLSALPTRLFHGNPLLARVSVRDSAISSLEAAHFPLDRLQMLDVAGAPLTCNCSLLWLWLLCREQRQHVLAHNQTTVAPPTSSSPTLLDQVTSTPRTTTLGPEPSALGALELHPVVDVDGIRCAGPPNLKELALVDVPEAEVRCEATWMAIAMVTVVVLALFAATCTVLFFLSTGRWCSHDKDASDVSTDSFATQHSSLHSNYLKHHGPLPPHPALPAGPVMMPGDMKVEPTYATIGVANGRSNFMDDFKKESDHLVNDYAYQRALKNSFNGGGGHHTLSIGRANHHDQIRQNGHGSYGTYHNHYSMAIDMTKKPPHIVYV